MKTTYLLAALLLLSLAGCHSTGAKTDTENVELKPSVYTLIEDDSAHAGETVAKQQVDSLK